MGFASATITVFGLLILGLQLESTSSMAITMAVIGAWGVVLSAVMIHRSTKQLGAAERSSK